MFWFEQSGASGKIFKDKHEVLVELWSCKVPTITTMSLWPWLAARWRAVSSPMLVALMRAPRWISMSTILVRPSRDAQCNKLNRWSSLEYRSTNQSKFKAVILSVEHFYNRLQVDMACWITIMLFNKLNFKKKKNFQPRDML